MFVCLSICSLVCPSETNKEDNILTDRNEEDTKVHKQKLKNAMSLLKVKKVDGSIDDIPF